MASPFKPNIATYCLIGRTTAGNSALPKGSASLRKRQAPSRCNGGRRSGTGKYKDANKRTRRVKLCADKEASKQILAKLVTDAAKAQHGQETTSRPSRKSP